jgi:TRAP transporter TAXI family solute receptor
MGGSTLPPRELGEALLRSGVPSLKHISLEMLPGFGAVDNVYAIQKGTADIAFTVADVAYFASMGQLDSHGPADRLRAIANFQLTPIHLVVAAHAAIQSVRDLKGHRVSIGGPGSGASVTARIVLQAFGIDVGTLRVEPIRGSEAPARLADGTLDAFFLVGGTSAVRKLTRQGARVLPLAGPPIDSIQHDYPFLRPMVIPGGLSSDHPVRTLGVDSLLICRSDLDDEIIYKFTKALFEALPTFPTSLEVLMFMDPEQAPATPIPLHQGAVRYYREREMTR